MRQISYLTALGNAVKGVLEHPCICGKGNKHADHAPVVSCALKVFIYFIWFLAQSSVECWTKFMSDNLLTRLHELQMGC